MHAKKIQTTALIFSILLFIGGCGNQNDSPSSNSNSNTQKVKVVINTWPGLGPYYVAQAKGFDKEEGIDLDIIMSENMESRRSSLLAGEVDLVGITLDTVIIAKSQNVPMTVVGLSDMSYGGDGIIAKTDIRSISDLKGKKIACSEGLPSHFFLLYLLKKHNLSSKDIVFVPADDGGQAAFLFTSGRVDAAVTWDPWISQAEKLTQGHVLVTTRDEPGLILGIVAANKNLLEKRRNQIFHALKAWFRAVEFCKENPREANTIMAEKYNVPIEDFTRMIGGAKLADLDETLETFGTVEKPGSIHKLASDVSNIWLETGGIQKSVLPEEVIDWSVIDLFRDGEDNE